MTQTASTTRTRPGFFDRNDFLLRRLHSLAGLVPLTLFMMEHMFTNMKATQGAEAYHGAFDFLRSLPGLYVIEIAFILLPLYYHALFGAYIWLTGRSNLRAYGQYAANWRYSFQRWTGVFVLLWVTFHLLHWRFGVHFPWQDGGWAISEYTTKGAGPNSFFGAMQAEFQSATMFAIYVLGLAATVFHLANGLWTFAITWGITRSPEAQRRWGYLCAMVGVAMFVAGVIGLIGFVVDGPMGLIQPVHG